MLDPIFVSQTIQSLTNKVIALQAAIIFAGISAPVSPIEVQGALSNVHMIYSQDMLGTGESFNGWNPINPLLVIKPNDPRGIVVPTSTDSAVRPDPIVTFPKPMYDVFGRTNY